VAEDATIAVVLTGPAAQDVVDDVLGAVRRGLLAEMTRADTTIRDCSTPEIEVGGEDVQIVADITWRGDPTRFMAALRAVIDELVADRPCEARLSCSTRRPEHTRRRPPRQPVGSGVRGDGGSDKFAVHEWSGAEQGCTAGSA
jgi:hypothetical protein